MNKQEQGQKQEEQPTSAYIELRDAYISCQFFPNYYKNSEGQFVCFNNDELRSILDSIVVKNENGIDRNIIHQYSLSIQNEHHSFYIDQLQERQKNKENIFLHKKYDLRLEDYLRVNS